MRLNARASTPISPAAPTGSNSGRSLGKPSTARVICTRGLVNERARSTATRAASSTAPAPAMKTDWRKVAAGRQDHRARYGLDHGEARTACRLRVDQRSRTCLAASDVLHQLRGAAFRDRSPGQIGKVVLPARALAGFESEGLRGIRVKEIIPLFIDHVDLPAGPDDAAQPRESRPHVHVDDHDAERCAVGLDESASPRAAVGTWGTATVSPFRLRSIGET